MTKSFDNAKVLCLNVELELKSEKENAEVRISDPDDYQSIVDAEWKIIYDKLALCVECGANVVLSKLPIGDLATQYFADRGLFCAGRVAADDLGRVCKATGATLKVADIDDDGALVMDDYRAKLSSKTKLVSAIHVSNALGTVNPVEEMIRLAHDAGALVLLDGAQSAPHQPVDVQALDVDFFVFSGHKVYGPTGVGVLYGRESLLDAMPPWEGGGDMIRTVTFEETTYAGLPSKFEAGTPNIAGAIGLGTAMEFLMGLDLAKVAEHEADLLRYATERLDTIDGLRRIGTAQNRAGLVGFVLDWAHPHDVGTILDHEGIAIRAGHHCAQPVMDRFQVPATARASFGVYNTREDIDRLVAALQTVKEIFAP